MNPSMLQPTGLPRNGLVCYHDPWFPNLLPYSEQWDNAAWAKTRTSVTANQAANPIDGAMTADLLVEDATAGAMRWALDYYGYPVANAIYCGSVYVKAKERTQCYLNIKMKNGTSGAAATFDLSSGTAGSPIGTPDAYGIEALADGWFRIWVARNVGTGTGAPYLALHMTDNSGNVTYDGDGTSGLYVYGAMVNQGLTPRPYAVTESLQTIPDLSGHGYTLQRGATTGVEATDPPLGGPGLFFNANDYALTADLAEVNLPGPWTAMVALKPAYAGAAYMWGLGDSDVTPSVILSHNAASTVQLQAFDGSIDAASNLAIVDAAGVCFAITTVGAVSTIRRMDTNTIVATAGTRNLTGGITRLVLGANTAGGVPWNGGTYYADPVWNRVLSMPETWRAYRHLKSLWAGRGVTF